ncbi:hypothetical protein C1646_673049 [Rhizophagus diaphanus]|nr:hypothetical protein C1646_673049 [Rhizophagus diaphanus] [Rhizophagus sp. MUCL 43196]
MDDISVKINDDTDKIKIDVDKNDFDKIDVDNFDVDKIDVDKNDVDKIFTFDDIGDEPHNGKPITMIEISPNENYLITYSKEDRSIAGWDVEDIDKVQLKFDQIVKINKDKINSLCVSDDKKLAYIMNSFCYVIDMNNKDKKIALDLDVVVVNYCTFNLKGEFILLGHIFFHSVLGGHNIIWIYSTQTKNNKWESKRFYRIPEDYGLISISKYDNVYLVLNDYIYEWNINTEKGVKIFGNIKDKNVVFGMLNEHVWKSRLMSKTNLSSENSDELNKEDSKNYDHLIIHSYMDAVSTLFQKATTSNDDGKEEVLTKNSIQWEIHVYHDKIKLEVFKKINTKWKSISTRTENFQCFHYNHMLIASSLFNNNDIVILTTFGILIYTFSENNKSIILNYFYFMKFCPYDYKYNPKKHMEIFQDYKKIFLKPTLPLPKYDSFRLDGWVSDAKNNKLSLLKYGVGLLTFAIKEHKLELIDDIYKKYYSWFLELIRPQPSPFTKTINRNVYKTWNGEALINFKWNTYGKYYYAMIWTLFMALLGCFTAAATIPQKYINEEVRQQLFIASIILGFIHLILEICQFFNNIIKWFYNFWNIFAPSYNQIIDNDRNINSNPSMIQTPDTNTNMFIDIRTSLFAMYLFLAGDSSALSNWAYIDNPSIAILIVLFSLLVVIYLMNLLIGLLNMEIGEDNNRVSYLIQKAEILAEIELFYLLPHQRRWETWFPEVIYYYADVDKTRIEVKRLIEVGEWDTNEFTEMRENLLKLLGIKHNPIDNEVIMKKLEKLEELEKSYDKKLEKLDKLEKLEELLEEIRAK